MEGAPSDIRNPLQGNRIKELIMFNNEANFQFIITI